MPLINATESQVKAISALVNTPQMSPPLSFYLSKQRKHEVMLIGFYQNPKKKMECCIAFKLKLSDYSSIKGGEKVL